MKVVESCPPGSKENKVRTSVLGSSTGFHRWPRNWSLNTTGEWVFGEARQEESLKECAEKFDLQISFESTVFMSNKGEIPKLVTKYG